MSQWITAKQAAEQAQCGIQAIYLAVKRRKLRAAKVNGQRSYRFLREWVDEWLRNSATFEILEPEPVGTGTAREH
jgi:excisionase family DNA binding protein